MSGTEQPVAHELVEPLQPLLGTWRGTGEGQYPTIESFSYNEEVVFGHVGKPFLAYGQKTKHADTGLPLHAENGFFRPISGQGSGDIEVVMAHPTGILESLSGSFESDGASLVITLRTAAVSGTATAVPVSEVTRQIEITGDVLRYDVAMAAAGQPLTHHLAATLHRS